MQVLGTLVCVCVCVGRTIAIKEDGVKACQECGAIGVGDARDGGWCRGQRHCEKAEQHNGRQR
jgi:predicted ThiF/HesA family dinucleotide-utilizing enzyme